MLSLLSLHFLYKYCLLFDSFQLEQIRKIDQLHLQKKLLQEELRVAKQVKMDTL